MSRYHYERLREPADLDDLGEFRLATLLRGGAEDDIRVTIHKHQLERFAKARQGDEQRDVLWWALSYCVGDVTNPESIIVEEQSPAGSYVGSGIELGRLSITRSLAKALRQLRLADVDNIIWIDAICIDQGTSDVSLQERAWQVKRMYNIYSNAYGVIIWLGPEADDSSYVFQVLSELGSQVEVDEATSRVIPVGSKTAEASKIWRASDLTPREHQALCSLLERPWFERVWIIQEAFLAQETTSIMFCGQATISFSNFRKAIQALSVGGLDFSTPNAMRENHRLGLALGICLRTYSDAPNIMFRVRSSKCQDARDKIFGTLGIIKVASDTRLAASITVNYSSSYTVTQTYMDFFHSYKERYDTLRLLSEAGLCQGSDLRPTWVPDWREELIALDLSSESAASHCVRAECTYQGNNVLRVLGKFATRISHTYKLEPANAVTASIEWYLELAVLMSEQLHRSEPQDEEVERITRTLCSFLNTLRIDLDVIQQRREIIKTYVQYLYEYGKPGCRTSTIPLMLPKDIILEDAAASFMQCIRFLKRPGLPIIFTEDDYVGVGPTGTQAGDIITVILGSRTLIVLRPTNDQKYQVVGPCSVHGLNWGEGLLGPLPRHYTVVPHYEPTRGGYVPYYLDKTTNEGSMWDPRIAWDELEVRPPILSYVPVTAPPGEPLRIRPDSDYLREHGVKLEEIDLV